MFTSTIKIHHSLKKTLTWWPVHLSSTHYVHVQMVNGLSTVVSVVNYNTVAVRKSFLRQIFGGQQQMAENFFVFFFRFVEERNFGLGDDQEVHRCLRIDVVKCHAFVVFVDYVGFGLFVDYLLEDVATVFGCCSGLFYLRIRLFSKFYFCQTNQKVD